MQHSTPKIRNASQICFEDSHAGLTHKSLYLDTLGAEARRSPSPVERHHKLCGTQRPSSCCEGYLHGALSTAGIHGARPAARSLTKHEQLLLEAATDTSAEGASSHQAASAMAGNVCRPNLLGQFDDDPGMRPKVLIQPRTNRPDLTHSIADIEGAQPYPKDVCHHPRDTNPLNPHYRLATGSGVQVPLGPAPLDKLLRDTLDIKDIPGAVQRPKTPAARAAAARAAAVRARPDSGNSTPCARSSSSSANNSSCRPGVLDVADIEGASAAWRPAHRRHVGVTARETCLDVSDIISFMARFKPGPRNSTEYKGHPNGPRAPSPIRPRSDPAIMDNSLRKFDIEGTSVRLAPRATHTTCLDVDDIEGTHPAVKDRAKVFADRKTMAAAATAQQEAAQTVLSGLELSQRELLLLWNECSRLDRERCGFLTGQELAQAMQHAQLQLSAPEAQHLATALQNNAGLLDYKKLTRQLKGHVSRPASTLAAHTPPAAAGVAAVQQGQPLQDHHQQQARPGPQQRPQSALSRLQAQQGNSPATAAAAAATSAQCGGTEARAVSGSSRPSTAPARPCRPASAAAACRNSSQEAMACASSWRRSNREGVSVVSHWFGGGRRDAAAAAETTSWRPGHAADALSKGWGLNGAAPWTGSHTAAQAAATAEDAVDSCAGDGPAGPCEPQDVVPAWLIGADALQGTSKVLQPFGGRAGTGCFTAGGSEDEGPPIAAEPLYPAARPSSSRCSHRQGASTAASMRRPLSAGPCCRQSATQPQDARQADRSTGSPKQLQRPMSAVAGGYRQRGPDVCGSGSVLLVPGAGSQGLVVASSGRCSVGLAERRRLLQTQQQDLQTVRMLS